MKASEQIEHATQELSGPLAVSVSFKQEIAFRRLTFYPTEAQRWQFVDSDPGVVLVLKPKGTSWHRVTDSTCDCESFKFRRHCWHLAAVRISGGVERVKALLEKYGSELNDAVGVE